MQNEAIEPKRKIKKGLIILMISVILIGGVVAVIFFNLFGSKDYLTKQMYNIPILKDLISSKPAKEDKNAIISQLTKELKTKEEIILEYEEKLKEKDERLKEKDNSIESLKNELEKVQMENELLKQQLENKKKSLKDIAFYYQNMDSQKAAQILNNLSDEEVIQILNAMDRESVSRILESLKEEKAAKITNILLKNANMVP
ncbi:MAG TPA: magnesium transporter MgtE [Clostridia bacterium]|nr:magnesium transporter MgtE [Clostridia bacterium]